MITLNYVIYDTIANGCLLAFAILIFKNIRFAWFLILASLAIKVFIYGKYGMFSSSIYLSAQILTSIIATVVWLKEPCYTAPTKQKKLQSIISSLVVLVIWVGLMYKYVNPAIIDYEVLFGFDYLCYMLVVVGAVFLCFRLAIGLLFISVEFISYAVNYANSAMVVENAPQYIKDFAPYYWVSAVLLFIAGVLLVASYTSAKRNV
ncbi:membrane protein [Candidatus Francisella endociliophora]|uniref:Membrane protein n=1 Tax=Candidatus Francisella endociliophora TaxID=653937 RepID=A0A097EQT5_9GAMM|nr:hypothetical protein [Francisella sp. FSC1006]AIT09927.1 membrane protein [Francisella sp. FSC1006]